MRRMLTPSPPQVIFGIRPALALAISLLLPQTVVVNAATPVESHGVHAVSEALRERFDLATFYQKAVLVGALPIVGSAQVSDAALLEAASKVEEVFLSPAGSTFSDAGWVAQWA